MAKTKALTCFLIRSAERYTKLTEAFIYACFFSTLFTSSIGRLDSVWLFAVSLLLATLTFLKLLPDLNLPEPIDDTESRPIHYNTIAIFIISLMVLSLFMTPSSVDGQRMKLARVLIGVNSGSMWSTSLVDSKSLMYYAPAPIYFIIAFIEALRLPQMAYSAFNSALIVGALLNLLLLFRERRSVQALFLLVLFMAAPQFVFSAIEEHEDALAFFLSTRAAVWLLNIDIGWRAIALGLLTAALAIITKLTTLIFLPFALFALAAYFGGKEIFLQWFKPRHLLTAALLLAPVLCVAFLSDFLVNRDHGITFTDQMLRLSAYHEAHKGLDCAITHFVLRIFEFTIDMARTFINIIHFNATVYVPLVDMMPKECTFDNTLLKIYFAPAPVTRETTQFGFLFLVATAGFVTACRSRRIMALCWALLLTSVAAYSFKLMYWSGTGRYFMTAMLILLPAFLLSMDTLKAILKPSPYILTVFLLFFPFLYIVIDNAENIPRTLLQGPRINYRAEGIRPALESIHGKANIYFNDLMPFYALLRMIPSHEVSLKGEILPDAVNIISIPREYTSATNWHDPYFLLPIPSAEGSFVYMGPVQNNLGNVVPTAFYMGMPGTKPTWPGDPVDVVQYDPKKSPGQWIKDLGGAYQIDKTKLGGTEWYFIATNESDIKTGLCLKKRGQDIFWQITAHGACGHNK